jgi:hypothetical protein
MNPKEIVSRTIDFSSPERLAHSFAPSDIVFARHKVKTFESDWFIENGKWRKYDQ